MRIVLIAIFLVQVFAAMGCGSAPQPKQKPQLVGWRPIESWSGRGSTQTESFNIESTQWRIKWEAKGEVSPGAGTLLVMVHSAVSGRPIALGVEHKGNGHGIAYVNEDPRFYHLVIESTGLNWSLAVEEGVSGDAPSAP